MITELPVHNALLNWMTTPKCNFKCVYCINASRDDGALIERKIDTDRMIDTLDKTGRIFHVIFSGGEPFFVPGIVDTMGAVSRKHFLTVCTNLSNERKVKYFCDVVDPGKVIRIHASLHIKELKKNDATEIFISNYHLLKSKGFNIMATEVAYPSLLKEARYYMKLFADRGVDFYFSLYNIRYDSETQPYRYTRSELDEFGIDNADNMLRFAATRKEIQCNAGYNAVIAMPDGAVKRCYSFCGANDEDFGSLESEIKFSRTLFRCATPYCSCPLHMVDAGVYRKACNNLEESSPTVKKAGDAIAMAFEERNSGSPRYCIVTNSSKKTYVGDDIERNTGYRYLDVLSGTVKHSRALMPILKDDMFDIIHIILSGEDAELVQNIRKTLGTKSKTKIVASYHSTGEASDRFLTLIHQKGIDLTGASLIFCPYRDSAGLIKHLFKVPVYILPDPADTSTIKRYHNPSRTRNSIALFIVDEKRLDPDLLYRFGNSRYGTRIFYSGSSGFRPELFHDALRLNVDETEDKELSEVLDESRFAYIQEGFANSEKYAIILSALSVPLVGDSLVEAIRRCFPSSLLYLKDKLSMLKFAERLLEDDSLCREIGELAQGASEYYSYENTKKRLLELVLRV